jgi:adenylate cyclase
MSDATVNGRHGTPAGAVSLQEAAVRVGVSAATLRRWAREGLIAPYAGTWSPAAVGHAKIVARLLERGHSVREIRRASHQGRLAFGYIDEMFETGEEVFTLKQAAAETGLEPASRPRCSSRAGNGDGPDGR